MNARRLAALYVLWLCAGCNTLLDNEPRKLGRNADASVFETVPDPAHEARCEDGGDCPRRGPSDSGAGQSGPAQGADAADPTKSDDAFHGSTEQSGIASAACDALACGPGSACTVDAASGAASCRCLAGYVGGERGCVDVDECAQDNGGCDLHAVCINLPGSHACECSPDYLSQGDGASCVSLCEQAGCDPHALCSVVAGMPVCTCTPPYVGDGRTCSFDAACAALGCDANAQCAPGPVPACVCARGFEGNGVTCRNVDDCAGLPCEHGGRCEDGIEGFRCDCAGTGFRGATCEENIDDCDPDPCLRGTCVDQVNGATCSCPSGYTGKSCELDRDDCAQKPCRHGSCVDLVDDYECSCELGYAGKNCQVNSNDCAQKPCVRGTCTDKLSGFSCACPAGYSGSLCQTNIDDCAAKPCARGTCTDKVADYACTCPAGYSGKRCEINDCTKLACKTGTVCTLTVNQGVRCIPKACTAGLCLAENADGTGEVKVLEGRNYNFGAWNERARFLMYFARIHGPTACIFPYLDNRGTPKTLSVGEILTTTTGFGKSNAWASPSECAAIAKRP